MNRRVIWIRPDIYVINDEFYAEGSHTFRQFFHFAAGSRVEADGDRAVFEGRKTKAFLSFLTPGCVLETAEGVCSGHYNQSESNPLLRAVLEKEGFASMITVINGGAAAEAQPARAELLEVFHHTEDRAVTDREAQAVQISLGDRSYVVIICHDEVFHSSDAVIAGNCMATGNVSVFDTTGRKEGERLYGGEVLHV